MYYIMFNQSLYFLLQDNKNRKTKNDEIPNFCILNDECLLRIRTGDKGYDLECFKFDSSWWLE